jgi:hypothetical protein
MAAFTRMAVILLVTLAPGITVAAPDPVQYELQERCGRRAAEMFEKNNPQSITRDSDGQTVSSYRNNFDRETNKCFILQTTVFVGSSKEKRKAWKDELLIDVNDNKEYGELIKGTVDDRGNFLKPDDDSHLLVCSVWGLRCVSERQWDQMIGRYMGDRD